jgi:hypothetical protein
MNLRNRGARLLFTLLASAASAAPASAGIIDQQVLPVPGDYRCFSSSCTWAQVVTPGMTGLLTSLQVFGIGNADLRFATGFGTASTNWTGERWVNVSDVIDLTPFGFHVTAGQSFVFELSNADGDGVLQAAYRGARYTNPLYLDDGAGYLPNYRWSLAYTTAVDAVTVPEPETAGLLLTGLLLLGVFARRKAAA